MNTKHIILLLSIVSLIACSEHLEDNQKPNGHMEDLVPVEFSISDQRTIDFTRAVTSIVTFNAGETVKVYVKPDGAESHVGYDYTTAAAGQSVSLTPPAPPTVPPYYPPGVGTKVEAYAYYPSTATPSGIFTVQDDQTSNDNYKLSDLMYADNRVVTKGGTDGHDHLSMAHQMAQLAITAQAQDGTNINITGVQVIAQKSVNFTPNKPTIVETTGATGTITALNGAGTGFIVIPPQVINGVIIKVITGDGHDDEIATYAFTGTGNFESGNSYNLNLTVSADQLGFTTAINNWNGVGSVNVIPAGNYTILSTDEKPIPAQEYIGPETAITPEFIVKKGDTGETVSSTLYDVIWVNNVNAGKAYIIVTGKDTQAGCVGMTSFTITPANGKIEYAETTVTKKFGNDPFTNPLTNKDKRVGHEGQEADGPVTYTSSDPTVATVDETGKVTLLKSSPTPITITATATNGANYVYSVDLHENTASYDLTVEPGDGTISFDFATPSQTWSPTAANNKYTQTVSTSGNPGDGPVTYSIGSTNTCGAEINSSTGEVSFTQSGSVQVIATVTNTEHYTYAVNTASYTLTVNKADGFITLSETSGSVNADQSFDITVSSCHGGALSAAATAGATSRISSYSVNDNILTLVTNGSTEATVTITVTCAANENYNAASATYSLSIIASAFMRNPLYYMAEFNVANLEGTSFVTSTNAGYYFSWEDAMNKFATQTTSYNNYQVAGKGPDNKWHLPIKAEWWSIIPTDDVNMMEYDTTYGSTNTGVLKTAYITPKWGYNNETQNAGVPETSYWKRVSDREIHAIRFLGTTYCSAWKYELIGDYNESSPGYIRISSTLISTVAANLSDARTWYNTNFSSVTWANNTSIGAAQRTIYARGLTGTTVGTAPSATLYYGLNGCYWVATEFEDVSENRGYHFAFSYYRAAILHTDKNGKLYGFNVLLFLDN